MPDKSLSHKKCYYHTAHKQICQDQQLVQGRRIYNRISKRDRSHPYLEVLKLNTGLFVCKAHPLQLS